MPNCVIVKNKSWGQIRIFSNFMRWSRMKWNSQNLTEWYIFLLHEYRQSIFVSNHDNIQVLFQVLSHSGSKTITWLKLLQSWYNFEMFNFGLEAIQYIFRFLGYWVNLDDNPRPTKGGGSLTVCLRPHKNANESDPGHLGHLFYILCGHFDEKKNWGYPPKMGVGWAVKVRR